MAKYGARPEKGSAGYDGFHDSNRIGTQDTGRRIRCKMAHQHVAETDQQAGARGQYRVGAKPGRPVREFPLGADQRSQNRCNRDTDYNLQLLLPVRVKDMNVQWVLPK